MLRKCSLTLSLVLVLIVLVLLGAGSTRADDDQFTLIKTIGVPGAPVASFDISWTDKQGRKYYLADRSNAGVDIFDALKGEFIDRVEGFAGFHGDTKTAGPNGILTIDDRHELWAGDGDSSVKVIDLRSRQIVDRIDTRGTKRADEMAFDSRDRILMVTNDAETIPYVSFIDTETHEVLGTLSFPDATDGIEQPVWDRASGNFLQAVPETPTNPGGEIAVIDPRTRQRVGTFPIPVTATAGRKCNPHGLVLGPGQDLLLGCSNGGADAVSAIMNRRTGAIVAVFTQVGGSDEVWFDPSDDVYLLAARNNPPSNGGPALGIIDAETRTWLQNVPTDAGAHSVAASRRNNHVFVPLSPGNPACPQSCIGVYANDGDGQRGDGEVD